MSQPVATLRARAGAIVLRAGHVLLQREAADAFWALPGGGVEPGEPSGHAVLREIAEEIGTPAELGRLIWIIENHFDHGGRRVHEIGFYYCVALPAAACPLRPGEFAGTEGHLQLRWFGLSELETLDLRPAVLRPRLAALPDGIEHLVQGFAQPME